LPKSIKLLPIPAPTGLSAIAHDAHFAHQGNAELFRHFRLNPAD
jgi:hypothetical protein